MGFMDDFAEALAELEDPDLVATSFTLGGTTYPCIASKQMRGGTLTEYGYAVESSILIVVRGSLFPSVDIPHRGHKLLLAGETLENLIERIETSPGRAFLRLHCVPITRGA